MFVRIAISPSRFCRQSPSHQLNPLSPGLQLSHLCPSWMDMDHWVRRMHLLLCVSDIIDSISMAIFGGRVPSQRNLSMLIQQNAILYAFAWRYHYSIHLPQYFLRCIVRHQSLEVQSLLNKANCQKVNGCSILLYGVANNCHKGKWKINNTCK